VLRFSQAALRTSISGALIRREVNDDPSLKELTMLHMFLICYDPAVPLGPDDPPTLQPQHEALSAELRAEGRYVSGGAPFPYDANSTIRVQGRKRLPPDGPYAESKEVLGGYYIVDCKDADDAEAVAMRIPVASNAWVQIRRLWLHDKA
jgi:hypothetical protein